MSALPEAHNQYTYADYMQFPEDIRCELINGMVCDMPAPSPEHQAVAFALYGVFYNFLKGHPCKAFPAPFDLLLPEGGESEEMTPTVLQPDLSVFCDPSKIIKAGAMGGPDLVVEILSPSTALRDQIGKMALYARHGVREYWIIDPLKKWLKVFLLGEEGKFVLREEARPPGQVRCEILEGLAVELDELFAA